MALSESDEEWKRKKKRSAEFTSAILEFADEREKAKKKTPFTQYIVEQARLIRQNEESGPQQNLTSAEDLRSLVKQLDEAHKKESATRRASDFLNPFFDGITRYSNVVDTLASCNAISGLVWGGFKVVLLLAGDYAEHYDNLTHLLEDLGPQLEQLGALSEIFDWSPELSTIVMKFYRDILIVLETAVETYSQSGAKAFVKGVFKLPSKKSKDLTTRLEKNMQSLRDSALSAHMYASRKRSEDNKITEWLEAPATDPTYDDCRNIKHLTPCSWLFRDSIYLEWEEAKVDRNKMILWICGAPGIGKTFLATSVIEKLKATNDWDVIYYYFRDEAREELRFHKGKALTMLRNLIRQLVDVFYKHNYKLPASFWDVHKESGTKFLSDIRFAIRAVQQLLAQIPRIHIVIDGLDECIDRHTTEDLKLHEQLPEILKRLVSTSCLGIVKWCFTGCPEGDLSCFFQKMGALTLEVTGDHVRGDILNYMTECASDLEFDVNEASFRERSDHLGITTNFLDANLTMNLIKSSSGITSYKDILDSVLGSKKGFNSRYLRGISALASKEDTVRELARRILTFVTTVERLLTRSELLDALAVRPGAICSCDRRPKPEKFEELLAPLLKLDRSIDYANPMVRFIHRTAKQFMQEGHKIKDLPTKYEDFFPDPVQRHLELGKVCLAYLSQPRFGYRSIAEMEATLRETLDEDGNSFLKYASIFWHHHLDKISSGTEDLFQCISRFMRSTNFLTCLWVQSKYAPYLLARYTSDNEITTRIWLTAPTTVFLQPNLQVHYSDPLPGWLSKFNEEGARLVRGCHLLIQEFGLVLLRRKGGIRNCYPSALGILNFIPHGDEPDHDWKILTLGNTPEILPEGTTRQKKQKHFLSVNFTSLEKITIRTIIVDSNTELPPTFHLTIRKWEVKLARTKNKPLKCRRKEFPSLPIPPAQGFFENPSHLQRDVFAVPENDYLVMSLGSQTLDLMKANLETDHVLVPAGFRIPEEFIFNHPVENLHSTLHERCYAAHGTVSAVSFRWSVNIGPKKANRGQGNNGKVTVDSYANPDSDSDSDSGSETEPHDSGYSSGGPTSSAGGRLEMPTWYTGIGIKGPDNDCLKWHQFETAGPSLKHSAPAVYPTKPFVLLPIDNRTVVFNYLTGERKVLNNPNLKKQAISRVYHFSEHKLFELITTRDFVQRCRWNVQLNMLLFDVDPSNDVNTVSLKHIEISSVSWISPYDNPYELPECSALPFIIRWTDDYVYLVFGACEVYIVRLLLDNWQNESTSKSRPRVEKTKEPAFLPASTTERSFTYIPISHQLGEKEYGIFAISGSTELPPVLIRCDIADLGGWIEYEASTHVGHDGNVEDDDMKGKYSCNYRTVKVPIRSGLAWERIVVECG